jgi:hypothetical protein
MTLLKTLYMLDLTNTEKMVASGNTLHNIGHDGGISPWVAGIIKEDSVDGSTT